MDSKRFDTLTKSFAARRLSRRSALRQGGVGIAAATLGVTGLRAVTAQNATPSAATPGASPAAMGTVGENGAFLFVQTARSGTWAPKAGENGVYTLTLTDTPDQTVYFSDRPARVVGVAPLQQFLDGLGFSPQNQPNAALVA